MLNEQNKGEKYEKFAPPMSLYSEFMIDLAKEWIVLQNKGLNPPVIGQIQYILSRLELPTRANIPGQTMFLLPNGDFVLPDYREGYLEYMNVFGNIFNEEFEDIVNSRARRDYLKKQYLRNGNDDCLRCEHQDHCIMEFWKENRVGDECFGADKFVKWVINNRNVLSSPTNHKNTFS